ncbi:Sodium- and chloride-dependent glycine transporter 1 [Amphibalanus amphitrite]|uniref:Sodium-and chloride-dependent glycine transporter 1 n=1 Tax=Amphibalanus amphitrite TaxID=1232801 RepID=A0A6A4VGR6_AMPAM|nr:Sodium- and chloride-dependent glycine transporter 1 [Amphibalanus amphitrite]
MLLPAVRVNYVLGLLDHWWDDYGTLKWDLCLCLLAAWLIVGLCLIRGVKSSGKVVYFTAVFPYFVLVILLVRGQCAGGEGEGRSGVTLDGAYDGISYYITPNTTRLADSRVWSDAATQVFYSFGLSFGGPMTLASYNRFNNNCMRDAILVGIINCGTSVFAGFVVFAVLGFMAKSLGKEVSEVVTSGAGLTFIAYPEAVVHMPVSPIWAVLFFVMIITLGLDSQFAMVETLLTAIYDQWPSLRCRKASVVGVSSVIGFLLSISFHNYLTALGGEAYSTERKTALLLHCVGAEAQRVYRTLPVQPRREDEDEFHAAERQLAEFYEPQVNVIAERFFFRQRRQESHEPTADYVAALRRLAVNCSMCANGGIHLFTLMDWYSGSWSLLVLALLEVVIVAWLFGAERMLDLMQQRMNIWIPRPLHAYWRFTWRYLSPLCIVAILVFSVVQYVPAYYGTGDTRRDYPPWVNGLGWIISLAPILLVIIVAVYHLRTSKQVSELYQPLSSTQMSHTSV